MGGIIQRARRSGQGVEQIEIKLSELQSGQFTHVADPTQKLVLQSISQFFNQKAPEFLTALQASPINAVLPKLKLFLPCLSTQTVVAQQEAIFGLVNSLPGNETFEMLTSLLSSLKQEALVACRENILHVIAKMDLGLLVKLNQFMTRNTGLPNGLFGQFSEEVKKALEECPLSNFTHYEYATDVLEYLNEESQHAVLDATELLAFLKSLLPNLTEQTVLNCKKNILDIITRTIIDRSDIQPTVWLIDLCTFVTDDTIIFKSNLSALLGKAFETLRDQSLEADKELLSATSEQMQAARIQSRLQAAQHVDEETVLEILKDILPQLSLAQFEQYKETILKLISKLKNDDSKAQLSILIATHAPVDIREMFEEAMQLNVFVAPPTSALLSSETELPSIKDPDEAPKAEAYTQILQV